LEVSHVELDVQLTKDSVPVVYHDWAYPLTSSSTASGSPMKLHPYELTARQFTALPPSVTPPFVPALHATPSTISAKCHVGKPSLPTAPKSSKPTLKLLPRSESFPPNPKVGTKGNTTVPRVILNDKYPTLGTICEALASNVGLFVEVKYPPPNVQAQDGIPYPEKNHLVDRILNCMFCETAVSNKGRSIRFLSFDADICFMLALKQTAFPVYFLHCEQRDGPECDDADPRTISIENGIEFAVSQGFYGMVLFAPMILEDETLGRRIRKDRNLSLMTYGRENRTREFVKQQYERGVECVITDEVLRVAREVRHEH
jgi:glycerophosphodiester phosphodiesterase